MTKKKLIGNEATQFKNTGLNITHKQKPISVMLEPEIDAIVRSMSNRSDWLRKAIREQLKRDGLLFD
ncbi:MAG: hypothetical protein EAZ09_18975 [Oscillatoriales cyanobacterium]|jgi:hypothetical protein|nr:MAG: hypothetical protein EAZ18_17390 [Oscillatoriales cyanobacterium]TAH18100.1 MAG: hypothetical protein EAZ09_18975 [Oscillatoriales cyanobacterium]